MGRKAPYALGRKVRLSAAWRGIKNAPHRRESAWGVWWRLSSLGTIFKALCLYCTIFSAICKLFLPKMRTFAAVRHCPACQLPMQLVKGCWQCILPLTSCVQWQLPGNAKAAHAVRAKLAGLQFSGLSTVENLADRWQKAHFLRRARILCYVIFAGQADKPASRSRSPQRGRRAGGAGERLSATERLRPWMRV